MIVIRNPQYTTLMVSRKLSFEEEKQLGGDIKNWLSREKSVLCKVTVEEGGNVVNIP